MFPFTLLAICMFFDKNRPTFCGNGESFFVSHLLIKIFFLSSKKDFQLFLIFWTGSNFKKSFSGKKNYVIRNLCAVCVWWRHDIYDLWNQINPLILTWLVLFVTSLLLYLWFNIWNLTPGLPTVIAKPLLSSFAKQRLFTTCISFYV